MLQEADGSHGSLEEPAVAAPSQESRRTLLKRLLIVGLPVVPVALVQRTLGLLSSALIGHLGDREALAAVGLCNVVSNITGYSWLWGLSGAISTLSSQAWGAKCPRNVGVTLQRGFLVLLLFADLPLMLVFFFSDSILETFGQPHEVARYAGVYTRIRIPGILCESLHVVVNRSLASIGNTRISLVVTLLVAVTNVTLSLLLIPRMGFIGAPITVTVCDAVQAVAITILAFRDPDFRLCWKGLTREAWRDWGPFLKLSLPSLALLAIEWWTWDLQSFLAGLISPRALAAQAVAPQVTDLQYCVGQAMNAAGCTVIGNLLGEGRAAAAKRGARMVMTLTLAFMTVLGAVFAVFRERLPRLFTGDAAVLEDMAALLPFTLVFSFLDSHQCALSGILVAAGRQCIAAPLIFVCYWVVAVPLGSSLAFARGRGLEGLWTGMLTGVSLHVLLFALAVRCTNWDKAASEARRRALEEQQAAEATEPSVSLSLQPA